MKKSCLVVEDHDHTRLLLQYYIEGFFDFVCHSARNVNEAKTLLEQNVYDLIFIDYILDDDYGTTLFRYLKDHYRHSCKKILISSTENTESLALKLGFDKYLSKPFDLEAIDSIIKTIH